jgi:hypothetical protein
VGWVHSQKFEGLKDAVKSPIHNKERCNVGLKRFLTKCLEAKEAERLANFLIDVCRSDKALKIMSDQCNFTPMEANRFIIGAGIYNLSNASIYLLFRSEDEEQAEKLIESLIEVFVKRFHKANDKVCVGDIIVYGPELDFIFEECGLYVERHDNSPLLRGL